MDSSRILGLIVIIILAVNLLPVRTSPVRQRSICGPAKCKEGKKFHYKAGVVYGYDYTVNGTTSIEGGPSEESGLHLSSKVAIKFLTACDAVLLMKDVQVWQSHVPSGRGEANKEHLFTRRDSGESFSQTLEQFPLRFSYADGVIEEICPQPDEATWALNIKRGLLSSFQNTMRRLDLEHKGDEDDVHGRCKTEYTLGVATSSTLTIQRSKNIGSCGDKFGILSSVQGTPYHFGTLHQSMPAVSSTSECEHVVDRNLVSEVLCTEQHRLKSLARGAAGASTNIQQSLSLVSIHDTDPEATQHPTEADEEEKGLPKVSDTLDPVLTPVITETQADVGKRESLQFRHDLRLARAPNQRSTAKDALLNFCNSVKEEVSGNSGDLFESLIDILRGLSPADIASLSQEAGSICQGDRTPFDDALEAVGTAASVGLIKDRILKGDAPPETIRSWIASLTYIPKPDLALMQAAVYMLRAPARDIYPEVLLTYSSLAHTFCRGKTPCPRQGPIGILTTLYERFLSHTNCVTKNSKEIQQTLMYLKGIGNFGQLSPGILTGLQKCILKNEATEIRVAAIESFRRMSCNADVNILTRLFENQAEDSEVRIASFIGLMRCPTYLTISSIKAALEKEEVNQVGSFVWSYLKNLQETALPSKAELQGLVADEKLSKKFSTDFRKFSRNLEISSFYDDFNFGIGLESNLIFSQKSYLPRSAMLNLTVDLFGESINVLEATVRLENFEHYVEALFGPNGRYRNKELHSIVSSFREKRAVPSKRKLKTLALEYDAMRRFHSDPIASLSFKTFGNEIFYKRKVGVNEHADLMDLIDPFNYLKRLTEQDTNWQKSKILLDSSYVIPTGVGLPLNLSAQASSLLKLEATSEIDAKNFITNSEVKLEGKLKPSALVTVMGSMIFGTTELQTGIKLKAHLRTSTAIEGNFHMKGSTLIQVEFGLPKTQLELIDYKSDILFLQENEFRVVGQAPRINPICTTGFFEKVLGLKVCRSSYFSLSPGSEQDDSTAPYFPLNGPATFTLNIQKANPSLMTTKLHFERRNDEKGAKLRATYEIKGLESEEVLGLDFDFRKEDQEFNFDFKVPRNELLVKGNLRKDGAGGGLNLTVNSNGAKMLGTELAFVRTEDPNGKSVLIKPSVLVQLNSRPLLKGNGEVKVETLTTGEVSFAGSGVLEPEDLNPVRLGLKGSRNDSGLTLGWDAEYGDRGSASPETIRWKSTISQESKHRDEAQKQIDTTLSLDFSEFPDYNLEASWKYQRNDLGVQSDTEVRVGKGPAWSERSALKLRHKLVLERSHDERRLAWIFRVTQPSRQTDWGLEASLNARGKSVDSSINLQYAPGKNFQTSLSLKRAPGVLAFLQIGCNTTLPNQPPLQLFFKLEETSHRVYQGKFETDWFARSRLRVDLDFVDRTRRQKLVDKELKLSIETTSLEPLKLRTHIYSDDKDSRLVLSSEYQSRVNAWELGHGQVNKGDGKGHKVYLILKHGASEYLVTTEVETENGLEFFFKTDLGPKFQDLYFGLRAKEALGVNTFALNYKWDASKDPSKAFHLGYSLDLAHQNHHRTDIALYYPGRNFIASGEHKHDSGRERSVKGRVSWDNKEQVVVNAYLTNIRDQSNSYQLKIDARTPHQDIRNASLDARLNCGTGKECLIKVDGSWGRRGRVSGVITSALRLLPRERTDTEDEPVNETQEDEDASTEDDEEPASSTSLTKAEHEPYTFTLQANLSSSVPAWEVIRISMQHTDEGPLHLKTDIDIQVPQGKEFSVRSHWHLPRRLQEIWLTRVHFQVKTPLPEFQNFDFQTVIGQQEDSDTLASVGFYTDDLQYSLTVTGTPRFEEDGALGFEIITSHAKYDKIFGSLSYAIGDGARLACQLGWPQVVVGLETGYEWSGTWEDFHVYYTFNSPWKPLKNINTLFKIDTSQAELKFLINEEGLTGRTEWVIESAENFDIRFDATTPLPEFKRIGVIVKHSFEEEETYYSQFSVWVNENQVGYKLEGGKSEVDEGDVAAVILNSQLEIDTIVYPTIRSTFTFAQRESKFNLGLSLLLREGPINVAAELHLLDLFRFNEKITITTPYPGLFELEINLTPAIIPESDLYNVGFQTKWRSGSGWQEGGLFMRLGDQNVLSEALTNDLAQSMDYPDPEDAEETPTKKVAVPMSQLFHFTSPLSWAKVIKLEVEKASKGASTRKAGSEEEPADEECEDCEDDAEEETESQATGPEPQIEFPLKLYDFVFSSDWAELSSKLQNDPDVKVFNGRVDLRTIQNPVSLKFDSQLDLSSSEKRMIISGSSQLPRLKEINLEAIWEKDAEAVKGRVDLRTPFTAWEVQHVSGKWETEEVEDEPVNRAELELFSEEYGKVATKVVLGPLHLNLILNTPFPGFTELELGTRTSLLEDDEEDKYATVITVKSEKEEVLHVDVESVMENEWPAVMKGTITTTLRGYRQGNLETMMKTSEDGLNANGQIVWGAEKLRLTLQLKLPEQKFQELDLKVDTPFRGYEQWKLWLKRADNNAETESGEDDEALEENEDNETEDTGDDKWNLDYRLDTPWAPIATLRGKATIDLGSSSAVPVKRLTLSGRAPNGSVDVVTSWILSDWTSFDVHVDSKYRLDLSPPQPSLPPSNFLKFKLRNVIPTLDTLTTLHSVVYYETQTPAARLGGSAWAELKAGEALVVKLSSTLPRTTHNVELKTEFDQELSYVNANLTYALNPPRRTFTSVFHVRRVADSLEGDALVEWSPNKFFPLESKFNCSGWEGELTTFNAEIFQPKSSSPSKAIGSIQGSSDSGSGRHRTRVEGGSGQHSLLVDLDVRFLGMADLDSSLNVTSSYAQLPSAGLRVVSQILGTTYKGESGGHLGDQRGLFNYNVDYKESPGLLIINGSLGIDSSFPELPVGHVQGFYKTEGQKLDTGLKLELDSIKYLDSVYQNDVKKNGKEEVDFSKIEIDNQIFPLGLTFTQTSDIAPVIPTTTVRLVEVYDLVHRDLHKLGGELKIHTNFNGREITLTGIHPSRRVTLGTNYEHLAHGFKQNTRFTWSPTGWLGYELDIKNMSTAERAEHQLGLQVNYPVRLITLNSVYVAEGAGLKLTNELNWNARQSERKLVSVFNWDVEARSPHLTVRRASVILRHPSLIQEIRGGGEVRVTQGESVEGKLSLDYSGDPKRRLTWQLKTSAERAHLYNWNLTADMRLEHPATNLDLKALHSNRHLPHELSIITLIDLKNSGKLTKKSKIAFELFRQLRKVHMMISSPEDYIVVNGQLTDRHPLYYASVDANITGIYPLPKAQMTLDLKKPYFRMSAVHGKDLTDGLYAEGGVIDSRNFKFDISESYDNFRFSDLNFFLRMNHSRLVTSKLMWRPELLDELQESYVQRIEDVHKIWSHQTDKLLLTLSADASEVVQQVWEDARTAIGPVIKEISEECNFTRDSEALQEFFEESLEKNDFYMQDITGFAQVFADRVSVRFSNIFIKIREYRRDLLGDASTSEFFEKALLWLLEVVKHQYQAVTGAWDKYRIEIDTSALTPQFNFSEAMSNAIAKISEVLAVVVDESLDVIGKLSEEFVASLSATVRYSISHVVQWIELYRPNIFAVVHEVEVVVHSIVVKFSDYLYETRDEVMRSAYYRKIAQLASDVDEILKDLLQNDAATNIRKYYAVLRNFISKKIADFDEYQEQLGRLGTTMSNLWERFKNLSYIQEFRSSFAEFVSKIKWLAEYTHLETLIQDVFVALYSKGPELMSQTVLEANSKYQQAKTRFVFDAEKGIMEWEQKLPMPWSAFNEPPRFPELPEYKGIVKLQDLFDSSGDSVWDTYSYQVQKPYTNRIEWLPPFDGHAMIVGSDYFFTFDGRSYNFTGPCVYLLAGDLVEGNFTVSIEYKAMSDGKLGHQILVASGHNTLIVDFEAKMLRDAKRTQNVGLPIQLLHLQGYRDGGNLVVENPKKDFLLSCNMFYRLCQLRVSGWYSRKIAGLLGTMDHEPTTDLIHSNGKATSEIQEMARSWDVSDDSPELLCHRPNNPAILQRQRHQQEPKLASACNKLFQNRLSSLQPCFSTVRVDPYVEMCLSGVDGGNHSICVSAMAYVSMCQTSGVTLPMPSICVKCDLNGEEMIDRDVKVMDSAELALRSTDIVLIVEAKDCNKNMRTRRKTDILLDTLNKELSSANFTQNRFAVVAFGGDGVYEEPREVTFRNEIFTQSSQISQYLSHIQTGNGSEDVFSAIAYSLKLPFRPGVSKTFLLFPCTTCQPQHLTMDFSTIHYSMLEQDATLHILMNNDLPFDDRRLAKNFFGMDKDTVFTKLDETKPSPLRGHPNLRRQVKVSKSSLGYCGPLALQTNGTIFNGKKLTNKREHIVNTFSRLFSRRVVQTADPPSCQSCYCSAGEDGLGKVNCFLCDYQQPFPYVPENDLEIETGEEERTKIKESPGATERTTYAEEENEEIEEDDEDNFNEDDGLGEYER